MLQVIGVGLGRTGTRSLKEALDILGYKTFHTEEMLHQPTLLDLFYRLVFLPEPAKLHARQVHDEILSEITSVAGYTATTDMPLALYFEMLRGGSDEFVAPDAKFILTTRRDGGQGWARSFQKLIGGVSLVPQYVSWLPGDMPRKLDRYNRWLISLLHGGDNSFYTMPHPIEQDGNKLAAYYDHHNQRVQQVFGVMENNDKIFLEYQVSDGWEPLCEFLGLPVPTGQPFPNMNNGEWIVWRMRLTVLAVNAVAVGLIGVVVWIVIVVLKKQKNKKMVQNKDQGPPPKED